VLVIGILAGRLPVTLLFLACFIALRSVAGGFHASTHFRCFLIMLGAYGAAVLPVFFLPEGLLGLAALPMAAVSLAIVIALAPAPHENRPVTPVKLRRFRALSLWLTGGEAAAVAVCFTLNLNSPAYAIAAGMLTAAASLCAAHAQARGSHKPESALHR
jgi:accessory gene regulator B